MWAEIYFVNIGGNIGVHIVYLRSLGYCGIIACKGQLEVVTLDSFFESSLHPPIGILKMDVKGFELKVV